MGTEKGRVGDGREGETSVAHKTARPKGAGRTWGGAVELFKSMPFPILLNLPNAKTTLSGISHMPLHIGVNRPLQYI